MPNTFAYLVLFSSPIVIILLFWKLPLRKALVASILGGYLFLPTGVSVDLPVLPPLDKTLLPSLMAGILCLIMTRRSAVAAQRAEIQSKRAGPARQSAAGRPAPPAEPAEPAEQMVRTARGRWLFRSLFAVLFLVPVLTVVQNPDPVMAGPFLIPGLRLYDIGSLVLTLSVTFLPFFLAQRFLARPEDQVMLLQGFVIAALIYSAFCLYEIRMSPQLSYMLYGFFPHSFLQHIRGGGYRPIVFLPHGLWIGIFLAMSIVSAVTLFRWSKHNNKKGLSTFGWIVTAIWLIFVLFLSKAVGALTLALIFMPLLIFAGVQGQFLFAMIVAGITLFYPLLRGAGWIPVDTVYAVSLSYSEERAESLKFRLDNEDILLTRAGEKPLAGWGSWGRNLTYDPYSGRQESIPDGAWVILIGSAGWIGYLAHFGLLTAPLFLLGVSRRKLGLSIESSGLALILAINLLDLIPNATLTPLTYLVAGALCGRYAMARETTARATTPQTGAAALRPPPKPGRAAWPVPVGASARAQLVQNAATTPPGAPAMAADSRKYRQPRRRPE